MSDKFKVADRRASIDDNEEKEEKTAPSPTPTEPSASPTPTPGPGQDQDQKEAQEEDGPRGLSLLSLTVGEITNAFTGILIQKAWIHLGLVMHPETGKIEKNLEEARKAIDLFSLIAENMRGRWGDLAMENEIQSQLTTLRLNFAKAGSAP